MYCTGYCWELCGSACDRGEGAVCALEAMRNLTATCATKGLCTTDDGDDGPTSLDGPTDDAAGGATPAPSPFVNGNSCDEHALCQWCFPFDACEKLYSDGVLQHANDAMVLLADLPSTCSSSFCVSGQPERKERHRRLLGSGEGSGQSTDR